MKNAKISETATENKVKYLNCGKKELREITDRLKEWRRKGYDTSMLEFEIKALDNKESKELIEKLKEWKRKGYNTIALEEKIRGVYGDNKKLQDMAELEGKIQEWKKKGYNTSLLEDKLRSLKR